MESCGHSQFLAEIPGKLDDPDAWVFPTGFEQDFQRPVLAAVINKNHFKRIGLGIEKRGNPFEKIWNGFLFIVRGDNKGDRFHRITVHL